VYNFEIQFGLKLKNKEAVKPMQEHDKVPGIWEHRQVLGLGTQNVLVCHGLKT